MDLVLVLVFVLVFLVSFLFLSRQKSLPPGPISLPVIGCVQILKKLASKEPYIVFDEAAKKYGKVMSFKIGQERFVILHGYDVIYQALVKQADAFSNRPSHLPQIKSLTKDGGGKVVRIVVMVLSGFRVFSTIFSKSLFYCTPNPLWKGINSIRKEVAPSGSNFFSYRVCSEVSERDRNNFETVVSPECVFIKEEQSECING